MSISESMRAAWRAQEPTTTTPPTSSRSATHAVTRSTTERACCDRSADTTRPSLTRALAANLRITLDTYVH